MDAAVFPGESDLHGTMPIIHMCSTMHTHIHTIQLHLSDTGSWLWQEPPGKENTTKVAGAPVWGQLDKSTKQTTSRIDTAVK